MAGVKMSESTMELRMPPTTVMASGWSICEPAPMAKANGNIPAMVAARSWQWDATGGAQPESWHLRRKNPATEVMLGIKEKNTVFCNDAITMIMPMNEATLKVVRVTRSASSPPKVESKAEARMAEGARMCGIRTSTRRTKAGAQETTPSPGRGTISAAPGTSRHTRRGWKRADGDR